MFNDTFEDRCVVKQQLRGIAFIFETRQEFALISGHSQKFDKEFRDYFFTPSCSTNAPFLMTGRRFVLILRLVMFSLVSYVYTHAMFAVTSYSALLTLCISDPKRIGASVGFGQNQ